MTAPSYVNVSTLASNTGTTLTGNLPGSRSNGNILIAAVYVVTPSSDDVTWPGGWTPIAKLGGSSSQLVSLAYCFVSGAETAPAISWTGTANGAMLIGQYAGTVAVAPIGAISSNVQGVTATITCPAITTTANDSLALSLCVANSTTIPVPSGWNSEFQNGTRSETRADKSISTIGTTSGAISVTDTVSHAFSFILELLSQATVSATVGSFALTGNAATLKYGKLIASSGAYSLTGVAAVMPFERSSSAASVLLF